MDSILKFTPAVFAVGNTYRIMIKVNCGALMWVKVGDGVYYDDCNGILRSDTDIHAVTVPSAELDAACGYTVCMRRIIERKPYFTETDDVCEKYFEFMPVHGKRVTAYHIADAHNMVAQPVAAARLFIGKNGKIDFLIMNGDIPDHSGKLENFDNIYNIAQELTGGNIPIVFARGNHDMRGVFAEKIADYTPCDNGRSYYSFRIGGIWGLILDCGEDKSDEHEEYGNTICCHAFRKRQTEYIRSMVEAAQSEYDADGVWCKLVVVHNPFTHEHIAPFDIEKDTYAEWTKLLREEIKPDLMLCGHEHKLSVEEKNEQNPCALVVGAVPDYGKTFTGTGLVFEENQIEVTFSDSEKNIFPKQIINI